MRGNLGHIWSFVIPPNPRWILLKKGEESLLYVSYFPRVIFYWRDFFWRYFCSRSNNSRIKWCHFDDFRFPGYFQLARSSIFTLAALDPFSKQEKVHILDLSLFSLCPPQSFVSRYWSTLEVEHRKFQFTLYWYVFTECKYIICCHSEVKTPKRYINISFSNI